MMLIAHFAIGTYAANITVYYYHVGVLIIYARATAQIVHYLILQRFNEISR